MNKLMKRDEYFKLRETLYKAVGELGTVAELNSLKPLDKAYYLGCDMLDYIDDYGHFNKYLDPKTNEELGENDEISK